MQLPKDFKPVTILELLEHFKGRAPTLGPLLWEHVGLPREVAIARIRSLEDKGLVQFCISPAGLPAVFIASSTGPVNPYTERADFEFADALVQFWDVTGKFDQQRGEIVSMDNLVKDDQLMYHIHTPEGSLAVVAAVVLRLQQRGLIKQNELGEYHAPSKIQLMEWTAEHGICDFCSDPNPTQLERVPDFFLEDAMQDSIGGWATCEQCHTLIMDGDRDGLLKRSVEAASGGKFTEATLRRLHQKFWEAFDSMVEAAGIAKALTEFIDDKTVNFSPVPRMKDREARMIAIKQLTKLTDAELEAMLAGDMAYGKIAPKLVAWRKTFPANKAALPRRLPLPPHKGPHWQVALDQKVSAIQQLKALEHMRVDSSLRKQIQFMELDEDLAALKIAEVFSFNADTMHAIVQGSQSIPHESTLESVEIPRILAGWFWFAEPLPIASSPVANDNTSGLLWVWDHNCKEPTLRFSAYVEDVKGKDPRLFGKVLPSTKWAWPVKKSFHEMIALNKIAYQRAYDVLELSQTDPSLVVGEDATMKIVAEMSLFFMMACLWFKQTVPGKQPKLTQEPGHIERHARKRYEKEFNVKPAVRVIALRKSAATATAEEHVDAEGKRHLHVRFVVSGHARLQPCGPNRADRKLIWIEPFTKGPDDAPFKAASKKVYAVIR